MLFTSSSDGTTVTPTTPPDNGTDPTSGTDCTATSPPDTSMCEFFLLTTVFSVCHGVPCLLSSAVTITLSTGLIAGIVVVCVVVYLLTFLSGCGVGVIGHVVYRKKSKHTTREVTSSVGLSITLPYLCMCVLIHV